MVHPGSFGRHRYNQWCWIKLIGTPTKRNKENKEDIDPVGRTKKNY